MDFEYSLHNTPKLPVSLFPGKNPRAKPKGVQRARAKACARQDGAHDTNAESNEEDSKLPDRWTALYVDDNHLLTWTRFFSLPAELRNHIYRQLLVRPCKFNLYHSSHPCSTRLPDGRPGPSYDSRGCDYTCAGCDSFRRWRLSPQLQIFTSPARSQWAKPHTNEYVCDSCYWDRIGIHRGDPCIRALRCLCARRRNLSILLVNKRIYNEAAPIFWSENYFAFEYPRLLAGFLSTIRPQVRSWIRRISFMPTHSGIHYTGYGDSSSWYTHAEWQGWAEIERCWQLLRACEGLVELELDVMFLKRLDWALLIRLIHVHRKLVFSRHPVPGDIRCPWIEVQKFIWCSHSRRIEVHTATTDLMAASMTQSRAAESETLKRHYAETTLSDRFGGDIYPGLQGI